MNSSDCVVLIKKINESKGESPTTAGFKQSLVHAISQGVHGSCLEKCQMTWAKTTAGSMIISKQVG